MFLRRRSQRVRHADSDSAVIQVNHQTRRDNELEDLKEELKQRVDDLTEKTKAKVVSFFHYMRSLMSE